MKVLVLGQLVSFKKEVFKELTGLEQKILKSLER